MNRAVAAMSVTLLFVLTMTGCGRSASPSPEASGPVENYGEVLAADKAVDVDPALQALSASIQRFTYASRSGINDSTTHVTGMLFVPKGAAPEGGWRLVAFGHPASGTLPECAPSLSPTLLNSASTVQQLLGSGYAVVMSDFQGLGAYQGPGSIKTSDEKGHHDSYHPFLDSTTTGYNLIDSVRAARTLIARASLTASADWLALGIGQGGQAAWAANELMDNHGHGLTLLGAVPISPVADINGLADAADAGTLNAEQKLELQAFLSGLKNAYRDDFNLDDYRSGTVQQRWDALLACRGVNPEERTAIADEIGPDDLRPHTPRAAASLRGYLQKTSLPQGPAKAPMLVIYGDRDPLTSPSWTEQALDRACKLGDVIQIRRLPPDAPDQLDISAALEWMSQRVGGVPAPNDCMGRSG